MILDPVVHAALVTLMIWLVNYLFNLIGINLGPDVVQGLATVLIGYILSLFGYALYARAAHAARGVSADNYTYRPPFI